MNMLVSYLSCEPYKQIIFAVSYTYVVTENRGVHGHQLFASVKTDKFVFQEKVCLALSH